MKGNTNTILLVVILLILVGGGVWWYTMMGPGAGEAEDDNALEVNIGGEDDAI